jgi:hypothetical protein
MFRPAMSAGMMMLREVGFAPCPEAVVSAATRARRAVRTERERLDMLMPPVATCA